MPEKPILILSALEGVERQILHSFLENPSVVTNPATQSVYYKGQLPTASGPIDIILGRTNQTNPNAGIETERAIAFCAPRYVFFVGVAGGLKDAKIGDVVVGEEVLGYERGKALANEFKARPTSAKSSYELEQLASVHAYSAEWRRQAADLPTAPFTAPVSVISGLIVSGEKVDASEESSLHKFLKDHFNHAQAVEMEGLAFLEACRHHAGVEGLLVRGISDLVTGKDPALDEFSQPYATRNAATFTYGLIERLVAKNEQASRVPKRLSNDAQKQLVALATRLYPRGILDNQIWVAAGGDASAIATGNNGKTQWREAVAKISNGGGGDITFPTLIHAMMEEHAKDSELQEMLRLVE